MKKYQRVHGIVKRVIPIRKDMYEPVINMETEYPDMIYSTYGLTKTHKTRIAKAGN